MATPTTTLTLIREQQEVQVRALVLSPTLDPQAFQPHRTEREFETWAEENPQACFRFYDITDESEFEEDEVSNMDIEMENAELLWRISYPILWAQYGDDNAHDLATLMRDDGFKIKHTIGQNGAFQYVAGQHDSKATMTIERGDAVWFLHLSFAIKYYRSTT